MSKTTKERPILFNGPMVRALLDGSKTQTRRIVKECRREDENPEYGFFPVCPYGQPGDRLWVRETFMSSAHGPSAAVKYRADGGVRGGLGDFEGEAWKPSIHMPRSHSRILLEVVAVRVEQLHSMTDSDAVAEGIREVGRHAGEPLYWFEPITEAKCGMGSPLEAFANLWHGINGDASWNSNPWVWVVEFKRVAA
jgi:hypothetical protein